MSLQSSSRRFRDPSKFIKESKPEPVEADTLDLSVTDHTALGLSVTPSLGGTSASLALSTDILSGLKEPIGYTNRILSGSYLVTNVLAIPPMSNGSPEVGISSSSSTSTLIGTTGVYLIIWTGTTEITGGGNPATLEADLTINAVTIPQSLVSKQRAIIVMNTLDKYNLTTQVITSLTTGDDIAPRITINNSTNANLIRANFSITRIA